jgi:hypothetical protein
MKSNARDLRIISNYMGNTILKSLLTSLAKGRRGPLRKGERIFIVASDEPVM